MSDLCFFILEIESITMISNWKMEISNNLLLLLSFIPFMYLCLRRVKLRNRPRNLNDAGSFRLPPGSTGFPLIGETLSYYSKIRLGFQYEFVKERMDKFSSKIFRTSLIGQPVAMLCNAEGNKFLFTNENKLVQVWWPSRVDKFFPRSNNQPTSEHSKWLRKLIVPWIFKVDVLRENLGVMDALMKQHLETYWAAKDVVKVGEMSRKYALTLGCHFFLGINDLSKIDELVQGMDAIEAAFFGIPVNLPGTALNRGLKASKVIRSKIEAIIRQRKMDLSKQSSMNSVKDLMSRMLLEVDENDEFFREADIASHLVGLMQGGYTSLHATIVKEYFQYVENEQSINFGTLETVHHGEHAVHRGVEIWTFKFSERWRSDRGLTTSRLRLTRKLKFE